MIFQKNESDKITWEIVGFSTYYPFFHYPDKIRMRIRYFLIIMNSQILILPPHQRSGHGKELYTFMYQSFRYNPLVVDITVEDPNDQFQDLRDRCDVEVSILF
jgi:histone acetyltransferase 1